MKRRNTINRIISSTVLLLLAVSTCLPAQTGAAGSSKKAEDILDKAIGDVFFTENFSVHFEALCTGLKKPEEIFKMPVYSVYRGGYVFVDGDKFEMNTGMIKTMSDGKLMIAVEERSKTMFIDSVKKDNKDCDLDSLGLIEFDNSTKEFFIEGKLNYQGEELINSRKCHKIRSDIKNTMGETHVIYWVDVKTGKLYLMAEHQKEGYTV